MFELGKLPGSSDVSGTTGASHHQYVTMSHNELDIDSGGLAESSESCEEDVISMDSHRELRFDRSLCTRVCAGLHQQPPAFSLSDLYHVLTSASVVLLSTRK